MISIVTRNPPSASDEVHHFSLLEVAPVTGRTHQIRAHLAHAGHPLCRDLKYYANRHRKIGRNCCERRWCARLFLHSHRLSLGVVGGGRVSVCAALPDALEETLSFLRDATTSKRFELGKLQVDK